MGGRRGRETGKHRREVKGVVVWHRAQWNPFPRRSEWGFFQTDLQRGPKVSLGKKRRVSLWAVAALVLK